jgi:hypothetical protein
MLKYEFSKVMNDVTALVCGIAHRILSSKKILFITI